MMDERPTIYIVDDDEAMRDSLSLLLRAAGHRVVTYGSALACLGDSRRSGPSCLILDIRMPEMNGLELQTALVARGDRAPIIFITGHGDVPMAVQAMQRGATDFLQKPFDDEALLTAVETALAEDTDRQEKAAALAECRTRAATLTPREREVMELVAKGEANKVIAADLGLSQRTVEIHRARVMEKMAADSLADLVRMSILLERAVA